MINLTNKTPALKDAYEGFKYMQNEQKSKGLNDFNLLTTVLKYHDEVRLHSRMIGALLDPNGKHYQGTLFLKLFLENVGLEKWFDNLEDVSVGIEYKDIDLYLSDGKKHLIIENKIWAEDQRCQIMKYINIIVDENYNDLGIPKENDVLDKDKVKVLYLTPRAKPVSAEHGLEKINGEEYIYFIDNDKLSKCSDAMNKKNVIDFSLKNFKSWYKKIDYKNHILNWLITSQERVSDIPNLYESLEQYKNVVLTIHNDYDKKVIDFIQYIKDDTNAKSLTEELFNISVNELDLISEEFPHIKKDVLNTKTEMLYRFFRDFESLLELENVNYYVAKYSNKKLIYSYDKCKKWFNKDREKQQLRNFGTFYKLNDDYLLCIFLGKSNLHFGLVKHDKYKILDMEDGQELNSLKFRKFKLLKWYSKKFDLTENLDVFYNYKNSKFNMQLKSFLNIVFKII